MASGDLTLTMNSKGRMDQLMEEMEKINQEVAGELQQVFSFSEQISAGVNVALRSLQFEDMTNQLIGHMENRLDSIDGIICTLSQLHKDFDAVKRDQLKGQFEQQVVHLRTTLGETLQVLGEIRQSPVQSGRYGKWGRRGFLVLP